MCKKLVVMVCFIQSPHHQRHTATTTTANRKSAIVELKALLEDDENRLEANRYLNMDYLRGLKKEALRKAA